MFYFVIWLFYTTFAATTKLKFNNNGPSEERFNHLS
jgi:hypothetical protein